MGTDGFRCLKTSVAYKPPVVCQILPKKYGDDDQGLEPVAEQQCIDQGYRS